MPLHSPLEDMDSSARSCIRGSDGAHARSVPTDRVQVLYRPVRPAQAAPPSEQARADTRRSGNVRGGQCGHACCVLVETVRVATGAWQTAAVHVVAFAFSVLE